MLRIRLWLLLFTATFAVDRAWAEDSPPGETPPTPVAEEPAKVELLPLSQLPVAELRTNLSKFHYAISSDAGQCQAFFNQGLTYLYAGKWEPAAQAFETAARQDAQCAIIWCALSRALEAGGKDSHKDALKRAQELLPRTTHREKLLITARLQDKGLDKGGRRAALKTLDELLNLYDDDEEGWFQRAILAEGDQARVPYLKTLQRINPLHPGANFELAKFYEKHSAKTQQQQYADNLTRSTPGLQEKPKEEKPKEEKPKEEKPKEEKKDDKKKDAKPAPLTTVGPQAEKLPITGLSAAKLVPDLCAYRYRITTDSELAQSFFDQGLAYQYSYVYMEAARSFEMAVQHDPENPMIWWGLSRALEKWKKSGMVTQVLERAQQLLHRASPRERLLIVSRLYEKGLMPGADAAAKRKKAAEVLDELISLYDQDEEAWFLRAELSEGGVSRVPFFRALLRINPLNPGANHELVHFFEGNERPALGWVYAENYIRSSPGIPHAFHMQAHLATRIGRWEKTVERSLKAIELQQAYHKAMKVKPSEDEQYAHHLETLSRSLIHEGRFAEAEKVKVDTLAAGTKHLPQWFRLHLGEENYDECAKVVEEQRKADKITGQYMAALLQLRRGDLAAAEPEVDELQTACEKKKDDKQRELRHLETKGIFLCRTGDAAGGLEMLKKCVDKTKGDYSHHAWGRGAYYMETWGVEALIAGKLDVAEEAFLEAIAHDPRSFRGALGMQVVCERLERHAEAERFAAQAKRFWDKAASKDMEAEIALFKNGPPLIKGRVEKPAKPVAEVAAEKPAEKPADKPDDKDKKDDKKESEPKKDPPEKESPSDTEKSKE